MLPAQRHQLILDQLARQGQVMVVDLAQSLGTSVDTIRRDLDDLAQAGKVQRVHGGAVPASPALGTYAVREGLSTAEKQRLATLALGLIRPGMTVALDGGTTNLLLARALPKTLTATIVTHSPLIAAELRDHTALEVILIGGRLYRHSQVAVGSETTAAIARLNLDAFFLGATGIHPTAGATTGDWEEAAVKRAFCQAAADTHLLASPEKLGAISPFQIIPAGQLTSLLVSAPLPPDQQQAWQDLGVNLLVT